MSGAQVRETRRASGMWLYLTCFKLLTPEAFGMYLSDMRAPGFTSPHSTGHPLGRKRRNTGAHTAVPLEEQAQRHPEGTRSSGARARMFCRGDNTAAGTAIPGSQHGQAGRDTPSAALRQDQLSL